MISRLFLPQNNSIYKKNHILSSVFGFCMLALLLFALFGCARYEVGNIDSSGKDIICFGNSITAGLGVSDKQSYPYILSELLGYPVISAGSSGDTSADGVNRLQEDVLSYQPRLVIIEFGGNDFLEKLPLSETVGNIRIMTEQIQAEGSMVAIADISSGMIMGSYHKEFKRLARKSRAIFIPRLLKGIIDNPSLKSDHIHPNAQGHRIIAQKVFRVIQPFLER